MVVLANGVPTIIEIGRAAGLPVGPPVPLVQLIPDAAGDVPEISITRDEYLAALDALGGIVTVPETQRQDAWVRFAVVRSAYDEALRGLAGLTSATPARWTTDRPATVARPRLLTNRPIAVDWTVRVTPTPSDSPTPN